MLLATAKHLLEELELSLRGGKEENPKQGCPEHADHFSVRVWDPGRMSVIYPEPLAGGLTVCRRVSSIIIN